MEFKFKIRYPSKYVGIDTEQLVHTFKVKPFRFFITQIFNRDTTDVNQNVEVVICIPIIIIIHTFPDKAILYMFFIPGPCINQLALQQKLPYSFYSN